METEQQLIERIFFPYDQARGSEVVNAGCRFAYYTTAECAARILQSQQIWMRNTATMNDYKEVAHGLECLNKASRMDGPLRHLFAKLDFCFEGISSEMVKQFNGWEPEIRGETYITCFSEHQKIEDDHGRLSMWRAYGGHAGVAFVFNGEVMFRETNALGAYAYPVLYTTSDDFDAYFQLISTAIDGEVVNIKKLGREKVKNVVFNMLRSAAVCTKHPGFKEEREWRVVASPKMYPSKLVHQSVEVVRGVPQTVLKIDLRNHPDQNLTGLAIPDLINRVIIGPCESPSVIRTALLKLLVDVGVPKAAEKIVVSQIPLRRPT